MIAKVDRKFKFKYFYMCVCIYIYCNFVIVYRTLPLFIKFVVHLQKYLKRSCNTNPQKATKSVRGRRAGGKIIVKT